MWVVGPHMEVIKEENFLLRAYCFGFMGPTFHQCNSLLHLYFHMIQRLIYFYAHQIFILRWIESEKERSIVNRPSNFNVDGANCLHYYYS